MMTFPVGLDISTCSLGTWRNWNGLFTTGRSILLILFILLLLLSLPLLLQYILYLLIPILTIAKSRDCNQSINQFHSFYSGIFLDGIY